ncbi:MAG: hypothetical protein ABIK85_08615 [Candidatus Eisenbacteria bacterium]
MSDEPRVDPETINLRIGRPTPVGPDWQVAIVSGQFQPGWAGTITDLGTGIYEVTARHEPLIDRVAGYLRDHDGWHGATTIGLGVGLRFGEAALTVESVLRKLERGDER